MTNFVTSGLPIMGFVLLIAVLVCGGLIFYALRCKGDVFAELSHGKTSFKINARDRQSIDRK